MAELTSRSAIAIAILPAVLALSGCGGGGGGAVVTPAPSPAPAPTPTPTPTPVGAVQNLTSQPPVDVYLALLLTDGTVMAQAAPASGAGRSAADFYLLRPDATGNYMGGSWTKIASPPAGYAPYAGSEAVLADGRALFVGGEYNQDQYNLPFAPSGLTNMSAVYNPVSNSWQMIAPPPGEPYIGDVASTVLPDGRFLFGAKLSTRMWTLDPATLTWSPEAHSGKSDDFAEEGFTQLPNGAILVVDVRNTPKSEHYVPTAHQWVQDGPTPVSLTSPTGSPGGLTYGPAPMQTVGGVTYGPGPAGTYFPPGEVGPAILRPDGTVFATGAAPAGQTAHTAIFHPGATAAQAGSWTVGPDIPNREDADDVSAALLVTGDVLFAGSGGTLFQFDGSRIFTVLGASGSGAVPFLLPLPNGQVLILTPGIAARARVYSPVGSAQAAWAPTITVAPSSLARGASYRLTGTQLNGLSEAAMFGDEFSAATNYPLVRITNTATGHAVYARTHGHTMGVATGPLPVTTNFDVPAGTETGASTLVVIANGIASAPVNVTVS